MTSSAPLPASPHDPIGIWPKTPQNVLVIVLDDCGVQEFSKWGLGSDYPPTPNIDALLAEGIRFNRGYASPVCGPTRACLQTGRYAFRTGFGGNVADEVYFLGQAPTNEKGLGRAIDLGRAAHDYDRGWFGKVHLGPGNAYDSLPNDLGYPYFKGSMNNDGPGGHFAWRKVTSIDGVATSESIQFDASAPAESFWSANVNVADAIEWIQDRTRPFFALVCLNPPHAPYEVPPLTLLSAATQARLADPANGGPWRASMVAPRGTDPVSTARRVMIFKATIEAVDTCIGRLISGIPESTRHNLTVILTGDNGTEAMVVQPPYDPSRAKRTVYEFGLRVPFLISGPRVTQPGRVSDSPVHVVDLWQTVLDLVGARVDLAFPGGYVSDSKSLVPLMRNAAAPPPRDFIFAEVFLPVGAIVDPTVPLLPGSLARAYSDGDYKLVVQRGAEAFYRITTDPLETSDLNDVSHHIMSPTERDQFETLQGRLVEFLSS